MNSYAKITAMGSYVPERILTNEDLEKLVDTNDEWIIKMTGIRERRIANDNEFTSDLCIAAAQDLMTRSGKSLTDVELIIVCTHTPDFPFPSVSSLIQAKLSIPLAGAIDLNATCAGFAYGLHVANGLIAAGLHRKILVVGADTMSKITDYTDRSTCILFGDGAGAALVEQSETSGFLGYHLMSEGEGGKSLYRTGISKEMDGEPLIDTQKVVQNGREVYKWAVSTVPRGVEALLQKADVTLADVDWFIPHSANLRIIESICERLEFPVERTLQSLEYYGNTSAATIPLALDMGLREGKIKAGDTVLIYGFGGGLVQAGLLLQV
ncbi:ketoacyl-ACP synthase III [Paenibacillus psychroresistens]|uniref:Beta-ketoacyl-[acyl-carrier-protein] synthase III n=1 Tax=Paenibacillus psychroresistens TaxID=1778678 RepID=A0A6B8RQI0_9BACL|nr:ketoacyl-ACP synthase III [Paenibacillus psychroresistens]QGQ97962.1 ketoacyl-ACP synthase III [Paenibacillus psychroresistens]